MAKTLVFCIIGALILSLTYVPMMASLFLKHTIVVKPTLADRFFEKLNKIYQHTLRACLRYKWRTVIVAFSALIGSLFLFTRLGAGIHSYFGRRRFCHANDTTRRKFADRKYRSIPLGRESING